MTFDELDNLAKRLADKFYLAYPKPDDEPSATLILTWEAWAGWLIHMWEAEMVAHDTLTTFQMEGTRLRGFPVALDMDPTAEVRIEVGVRK